MHTLFLTVLMMAGDWDAVARRGTETFRAGRQAEALPVFEESWRVAETPLQQAVSANNIASSLVVLGRNREARGWYESGLALWQMLPEHGNELAETGLSLADLYRVAGDFAAAEKLMREMLKVAVSNEGRAAILNSLGDMLREQSRKEEARQFFESAQAIPGVTVKRRIEVLLGLGDIDRGTGRFNAAQQKWKQAAELARTNGLGRYEALAMRGMGLTFVDSGEYERAEPLLRKSLGIFEKDTVQDPRQLAAAWSCLAEYYKQQGKLRQAEDGFRHALEVERKVAGDRHPQTALILEALASIYAYQKRFGEAYAMANEARAVMVATFGEGSIPAAGALATVALVEQREKKWAQAAVDYEAALRVLKAEGAPADYGIGDVVSRYRVVLGELKRKVPVDSAFR